MTFRVAISQTARLATQVCSRGGIRRKLSTTSRHLQRSQDDEDMDKLQKNPYFDKYADKIAKLQKTSPEEFMNRLTAMEEAGKKADKAGGSGPVEEKAGFIFVHFLRGFSTFGHSLCQMPQTITNIPVPMVDFASSIV